MNCRRIPLGPLRLCYIKNHKRKYGPDVLLRALVRAREAIPDVRLTMAGEGEITPQLKHLAVELGVDEIVDFVGSVSNERIYSLVQEHHLMIMPSIMESESFGVAVLEASACGPSGDRQPGRWGAGSVAGWRHGRAGAAHRRR